MQSEDEGTSLPRKVGMEGYYDKIVPETLNKLAKEYGVKVNIEGGKVSGPGAKEYQLKELKPGQFAIYENGKMIQNFLSQQDAASYMKQMEAESTPVHTLDVPESMKQQIKTKGFPLYSRNTLGGLLEQANA